MMRKFYKHKGPYPPLCRTCGTPIPKHTETVWVEDKRTQYNSRGDTIVVPEGLHSKADCQKHTNQQVASIRYTEDWNDDLGKPDPATRRVRAFTTWDGESYEDQFFCNGTCARDFGYMAAGSGKIASVAYNDAWRRQRGAKVA